VKYAIRRPANDNLLRDIKALLTRLVVRPRHKPVVWYKGFLYQAATWMTSVQNIFGKIKEVDNGRRSPRQNRNSDSNQTRCAEAPTRGTAARPHALWE
jgi:hypothetical protein